MKEEVLHMKTCLENAYPKKQNRGRRKSTISKNLSREHRFDEEESQAGGEKKRGRRSSTSIGKLNGGT